jgi:hypothetical protein
MISRYTFLSLIALGLASASCSQDDVMQNNASPTDSNNTIREIPDSGTMRDLSTGPVDATMSVDQGTTIPDLGSVDAPVDMPFVPPDRMCQPGEVLGCSGEDNVIICNDQTMMFETRSCPAGEQCLTGVGCTDMICAPGTQECDGGESYKSCAADGKGYDAPIACDEGTLCSRGACVTQCELGKYESSYVGCEYWTLDLDQYTDPTTNPAADSIPHAVVISNPGTQPATVTFRATEPGISINVPDPVVPPGGSRAFTMPRLDISGTGISKRSIRVSSSVPVTAHQFSPLNNERVYSNDASLLLPSNTLGVEYYVVGWPTSVLPAFMGFMPEDQHGYVTILATSPGETFVNVTPRAQGAPSAAGQFAISPGSTRSFSLKYGEVLNLEANSGSLTGPNDLTGSHIKATQPIAVFSGHEQAVVGQPGSGDSCCADHIEQQLFPLKDWGTNYIATLSPGRGEKADHWRIVAGEDGVTLNTNPPQPGANGVTLNRGEFVAFFSEQSFEINATGKVLVGQILVSQQQTSEVTGDPALILSVPTERFRSDYILLTPTGYSSDYVVITREAGEIIRLNGQPVPEAAFSPIGSGIYEAAEVLVTAGVQSLEATKPFGIAAYGFNNAVSYGYPGGLNLVGAEAMP